jgi:hypothetical protein
MSESINKLNETLEQMLKALFEGRNWSENPRNHVSSASIAAIKPPMDTATKGPVYAPDKSLDKNIEMLTTNPSPGSTFNPDDTRSTKPLKRSPDETQPINAPKPNITRIKPGEPPTGPFTFREKISSPAEQAALKSKTK